MTNHFAFLQNGTKQYIESDMHCKIDENSNQLLMWFEYFPNGDKWILSTQIKDVLSHKARESNHKSYWDRERCGWFPMSPVNWAYEVFGNNYHEYSDFLFPKALISAK
jgi:hypothetical protein